MQTQILEAGPGYRYGPLGQVGAPTRRCKRPPHGGGLGSVTRQPTGTVDTAHPPPNLPEMTALARAVLTLRVPAAPSHASHAWGGPGFPVRASGPLGFPKTPHIVHLGSRSRDQATPGHLPRAHQTLQAEPPPYPQTFQRWTHIALNALTPSVPFTSVRSAPGRGRRSIHLNE